MTTYLINFIVCSGLLLIVYHLFLQNERMYRFNRFYLLFSLVFSMGVSFITITTKTKFVRAPELQDSSQLSYYQNIDSEFAPSSQVAPSAQPVDYLPIVLTGFYSLVVLVLLTRFGVNLYRIRKEIKENQLVDYRENKVIITNAEVTPHSFLNYIIVNRNEYAGGAISPEIILHEHTHVKQLHSLDVMLIELIQAIFWFNPFIPFYRKAIQLNHEFLADEAVIEKYDNTPDYQHLLLAKASQAHSLQLTSQFNYLTTKKRLIMMTKTTSTKIAWGKKLILLPVIAGAVLLFSQKIEAEIVVKVAVQAPKQNPPKVVERQKPEAAGKKPKVDQVRFPPPKLRESARPNFAATDAPQAVLTEYAGYVKKYNLLGKKTSTVSAEDKARMNTLFTEMSKAQQDEQRVGFAKRGLPMAKNTITTAQLKKWMGNKDYMITVDNKKIDNEALANYSPEDFDRFYGGSSGVWGRVHQHVKWYVYLETKAYYAERYKKEMADRSDVMFISPTTHMFVDVK